MVTSCTTVAADTSGPSASSRTRTPSPIDAAYIIRASWPPPMMPTTKGRALVTTGSLMSPQPEDQRALDDEVDRGGHSLGDHEADDLDCQPVQALRGQQGEQQAEQPDLQGEGQRVERHHREEPAVRVRY